MKNSRLALVALLLAVTAIPLGAGPAAARPDLCEAAIGPAARAAGIPEDVLRAIALAESGRTQDGRLRPWPWAANGDGAGHWFATRAEAVAFAHSLRARGRDSFDLGCFQINWRWHGDAFASPEELLDPPLAARYAARFLARLHAEFGDWEAAAGAYHSRTPERAARYAARFSRIRAALGDQPAPPAPPATRSRPDPGFALLAGPANGASLVPAALPAARPLFERRP